jgi:hypothetical protein
MGAVGELAVAMTPTHDHSRPRGFRRGPRVADSMTPELQDFVDRFMAAEQAGDAAEALDYHSGIPMFTRSRHRMMLQQLTSLATDMTPWLWARWAAYQCTRCEESRSATGRLQRLALLYAVEMFHDVDLQAAYDAGGDPVKVTARVLGESWAFHQLCIHEWGGLASFLDELATGRLADHATLARSWLDTPMGGYQVDSERPSGWWVRDLATGSPLELLDLGGRVAVGSGEWLIGRVVPSGTTPGWMFDTRPLGVDRRTAREVAADPSRGAWVTALHAALVDRRVERSALLSEDYELVTDVPDLRLVEFGTPPAQLDRVMGQLRSGRDEVGRAAFRVLGSAAEGRLRDDEAAYVGAAILNLHAHDEARRLLLAPGQESTWIRWAGLVPEPARARLLGFAAATRAVA